MIVGFVRCGTPIYIEVPFCCFPFHIPPMPSFPLSPHFPAHRDKLSSERRDSQGRVTFRRAIRARIMPVRLIAAADWRPSIATERRLRDLEREGLLCPLTSLTRPEWIAPLVEHREPSPPEGYVVSFIKFHRHGLRSPLSRFMRALLHHYGVEL